MSSRKRHYPLHPPRHVASADERRTPEGLRIVQDIARLMSTVPAYSGEIFAIARKDIDGFSELYAHCPDEYGAANKFVSALNSDLVYWAKQGHAELKDRCKFSKSSTRHQEEAEDQTEDSGEPLNTVASSEEARVQHSDLEENPALLTDKIEKIKERLEALDKELAEQNRGYEERVVELKKALKDAKQHHQLVRNSTLGMMDALQTSMRDAQDRLKEHNAKKQRTDAMLRLREIENTRKALAEEEAKLKEILTK